MKFNKTLTMAALIAASLFSGNALLAQDATNSTPAAPVTRPRHLTPDQMATQLGLSDDVATKFKAILQDQKTQLADLRNDTSLSTDDKKAKRKEIMQGAQAKLKDILTPDQLTQYKKLMPAGGHHAAAPMVMPDTTTPPTAPTTPPPAQN